MTLLKNFREINWFPYYKLRSLCQELFYVYVKNFQFFPGDSDSKKSTCNAEKPVSIPGSGRSPGEGNGNRLQYSCLENSMDRPWGYRESDTTDPLTQCPESPFMLLQMQEFFCLCLMVEKHLVYVWHIFLYIHHWWRLGSFNVLTIVFNAEVKMQM